MKTFLLTLALALSTAIGALAYSFEVDGIYYNINRDTTSVSVTYKKDYLSYKTYSGDVTIPAEVTSGGKTYPVTAIGANAFYKCSGLTSVTFPNTIKEINDDAFYDCTALGQLILPDSIINIGAWAFNGCKSLTELYIPASVQEIETAAFSQCHGLTSIVVDENNAYYDSRENCNAIIGKERNNLLAACVNTVIPNSVKWIGTEAFFGFTWLTEVNLPDSLERIGGDAFRDCSGLTSIDIPSTVTYIGSSAFAGTGLIEVDLPESLQTLYGNVFMDCPEFTRLYIPANVTLLQGGLVCRDQKVTSIIVDPRNTRYDSRDNCNAIIETENNTLIEGCNYSTVPEGVRCLGSGAFFQCELISHIDLPSSLHSIWYGAFQRCYSLTSIHVPEGVVQIEMDAFRDCKSLTSISLPSTLDKAGIDNIGTYCFYGCNNLKDITCYAETPPQIGPAPFGLFKSETYTEATLYVPQEYIQKYKSADFWCRFTHISPIGDSDGDSELGISDVTTLIDLLLNNDQLPYYTDVNDDESTGIDDVTSLIDMLLNGN